MDFRCIGITGPNNVAVGSITASDLDPSLLLVTLALALVDFLILMLVDHPTTT
jgi:hypothetical protein